MKKLLVILLVLGMTAPAMAADWNMYGSARVKFFYNDFNDKASGVTNSSGVAESDTDLDMGLQGNARIGANVKASDEVTGHFEYGSGPNLRLLYGTWNFGSGAFTVGQDYTPIDTLYSNQVIDDDIGLLEEGCVYEGRVPLLRLKMGGFQAAFVQPKVSGIQSNTDVIIPKIELAYDMKMDTLAIGGFGGYQTYRQGPSGADWDTNSWIIGVRAKVALGPAYINAVLSYGQNEGNYGILLRNSYAGSQLGNATATEDATTFAGCLVVGAKFNDMVAVEAGVGYMKNQVDAIGGGATQKGDATTYYVQAPITLAPGVYIVPEIDIFDLGEQDDGIAATTNVDNGQRVAYGAKFQINF
jgi:hypothetical protein